MKRGFTVMTKRKRWFLLGSIVLYVVLALALLVMLLFPGGEGRSVFGSMEGRFRSDITMRHEGRTYYYRENEITNYLIIGLDRSDVHAAVGHQDGGQADFLVVLSIDRVNRTITPVMLDRDTMVPVQTYGIFGHPSGTRVMQLCLAQAYSGKEGGGSRNTARSVESLLYGIKIDRYITMDTSAIPVLNDALGGVEVTLKDDFTSMDPAMVKGATLRLSGKQAAFFVRGRMTVADGTNASRMQRQQQYLDSFLTLLRQEAEADPERLAEILDQVSPHIESDASRERLLQDADAYGNYDWQPMRMPEGTHEIDEYGFAEFYPDDSALRSLAAEIWFTKEAR